MHLFQVPYYSANQGTGGPQMRYMYPTMPYMQGPQQGQLQSQGSVEGPAPPTPTAAVPPPAQPTQNGQFGGQQYVQNCAPSGYPMVGYPSMTVQTIDGYPQQTYQQSGAVQGYQVPQGQGQPEVNTQPPYSTQYQAGATSTSQPSSYVSQSVPPMFYNTSQTTNGSQVMTYPSMGTPMSGQGSYRPRTPPSQVANGTAQPVSIGVQPQQMSNVNVTASAPQYVSYSAYPPAQTGRPQVPHSSMVPFQGVPNASPPQAFPMVRPNMQISMHMQTRTTPPPAGTQYSQVPMVTGAQPIKMYGMDQRSTGKSVADVYKAEMTGFKDMASGNGVVGPQGPVGGVKAMGLSLRPVAPAMTAYRTPPINPGMYHFLLNSFLTIVTI